MNKPMDTDGVHIELVASTNSALVWDLNRFPWPLPANRFREVVATDVIEPLDHLAGPGSFRVVSFVRARGREVAPKCDGHSRVPIHRNYGRELTEPVNSLAPRVHTGELYAQDSGDTLWQGHGPGADPQGGKGNCAADKLDGFESQKLTAAPLQARWFVRNTPLSAEPRGGHLGGTLARARSSSAVH